MAADPAHARRARRSSRQRATRARWKMWVAFAFAVVGPLVLTNVLWFTAIDRVGPSRASLFANLQFFLAAVFGVILLSETITPLPDRGRRHDRRRDRAQPLSSRRARAAAGRMSVRAATRPHAAGLPLLDRPRARDLHRADGDAAARGARPDDRRDRAAADRLRPRRHHAVLVGLHRLHAHLDRDACRSTAGSATCTGGGRCS